MKRYYIETRVGQIINKSAGLLSFKAADHALMALLTRDVVNSALYPDVPCPERSIKEEEVE